MIHTKTLKEAVLTAAPGAFVWKKGDTCLGLSDLLALAEAQDAEPLAEGSFYVVSREGAIGLAERFEYCTSWLWLPLQGEELVSALTELGAKMKERHDASDAVVPMPEEDRAAALAAAEPEPEPTFVEAPPADAPIFDVPPVIEDHPIEEAPQLAEEPALEERLLTPDEPTVRAAPAAPSEPVCPACGHTVRKGDRFCIYCGSPIAPKPEPEPKSGFCIKCGAAVKPTDRFCMTCGTKI